MLSFLEVKLIQSNGEGFAAFLVLVAALVLVLLLSFVGAMLWAKFRRGQWLASLQHQYDLERQGWQAQLQQQQKDLDARDLRMSEVERELKALKPQLQVAEKSQLLSAEKLRQLTGVQQQLHLREAELLTLARENASIKAGRASEQAHFAEQLAALKEAKVELSAAFENIAHKIFEEKQQRFNEQSLSTLSVSIDPLKAQLQEFRQRVDHVYDRENAERNKLAGQIAELQSQTLKIGEDAVNLASALKGDNKAQGNWGEVILERLLEDSGLQKGREYDVQVALVDADGRRRNPDVIIHLPEGKDIVVDAKVSLLDFERYSSSDDAAEKDSAVKRHLASMRAHIKGLSVKGYEQLEGVRSLDFVFVFVPVEAAFMLALQKDPALFREAYQRQVILVSPTTLLATLRAVESVWRYEKQNKNAEKIATQAGGLYDQFVLLLGALDDAGKHLTKTQESFTLACNRLGHGRGNLLRRVEEIKQYGAKTKRSIAAETLESADLV